MISKTLSFSLLFLLCCNIYAYAADNVRFSDIRAIASGGQGVILSSSWNPALLSHDIKRSVNLQYINKYGLSELSSIQGNLIYPNPLLPLSVNISSFGYDKYRENMFRVGFGKRLSSRWSVGLAVQYYSLNTDLFDERPAYLSTDIALSFFPVDKLLISMLIMNAPLVSIGDKASEYKSINEKSFDIGARWHIINSMLIMCKFFYANEDVFNMGIGLEYTLYESFFFRAGLQTASFSPSFGVGYQYGMFGVDVAVISHSQLGYSTGIGVTFHF